MIRIRKAGGLVIVNCACYSSWYRLESVGMKKTMRLPEIHKKYRNEWVLIEFSKLDKDLRVREGKVIAHASNKEDIYKALLGTRGKNVSVEYCGKIPEDLSVMLGVPDAC